MSCNSNPKLDVQGHRGCRGLLPENSLPAFEKAVDLGVQTLELDIAITKDKEVVVSHEPFISRFTCLNPEGNEIPKEMDMAYNLYHMTNEEIKEFDCGSKYHPSYPEQEKLKTYKPLLSEVFEMDKVKESEVKFNIELKSKPEYYGIYTPHPEEYVKIVLNEIEDKGMFNRVNLQSFDLTILEEIKKQSPKMKIALLIDKDENIATKLAELSYKPEIISPYFELLTSHDLIMNYQDKGYKIIPWTVNEEQDMFKMLRWNVDGIITDYPDRLLEIRKNNRY
ncbi:glycerophosphodiester phosphodiesterase family protein [Winogradskyella ouciana]|uniref:Glycerophosphodiester phosphodiesterase n=1 Tax=Winogradskyella ouciana TaxID=2608631 RepID=A0A7K1GBW5_9FLAO|nr:glycerophosphodiester phosphodiesterase family protein [Winogradskyella ouciana]MTE26777.1 glycerophosphodiester phosphodiesterase [Winogradskyella ouciana]